MGRSVPLLGLAALSLACGTRSGLDVPATDGAVRSGLDGGAPEDGGLPVDGSRGDGALPPFDAGAHDGGTEERCPELRLRFGELRPTVLLVLDRSGSMRALFGRPWTPRYSSASRWEVLRGILVGDARVDGLLDRNARRIRYGLITYSSSFGTCPDLRVVLPRLDNEPAIEMGLGVGPRGGTPTAEALSSVTEMLPELVAGDEPVAVILATDGVPTGCRSSGGRPTADTVDATAELYERGVRTFVLSVGEEVSTSHLQDVANAGAGRGPGDGDAEFWVGAAPASLREALDSALGSAITCVAVLSDPVDDLSRACELEVTIDGEPVPCDDPDGFHLPRRDRIEFSGAACARLRTPGRALELDAPCDLLGP
ncbi:MAG TPA: VWA domain-containing protein [Sandaracinaceae bacterium LLY-WYZ-13_1]|nr:VWA domain-containing protein [Sandaracinaceae bacterium LLY-WYZ-13_1]